MQTTMIRKTAAGTIVKGRPDWIGAQGGAFQGLAFDLTTTKDVTKHLNRFYGENLVVFPYEVPTPTWGAMTQ
jgi:hypothetical protein